MDEELEAHGLENADILELFCLQGNLQPGEGCDGPKVLVDGLLPSDPAGLHGALTRRWAHVVGAYLRQHDDVNHLLVNNAYTYIKENPLVRWQEMLTRSCRNAVPTWSCCANIGGAVATQNQITPAGKERKEDQEVDQHPTLSPNDPQEQVSELECRSEYLKTEMGDETTTRSADGGRKLQPIPLVCPCRQKEPFATIRKLVHHARECGAVHSSALVKSIDTLPRGCLFCNYRASNYTQHESRPHYICSCGNIATKHKSHEGCGSVIVNPVEYLTSERWKPPIPTTASILDNAFVNLQPSEVQFLVLLNDERLNHAVRQALEKHSLRMIKEHAKQWPSKSLEANNNLFDSTLVAANSLHGDAHAVPKYADRVADAKEEIKLSGQTCVYDRPLGSIHNPAISDVAITAGASSATSPVVNSESVMRGRLMGKNGWQNVRELPSGALYQPTKPPLSIDSALEHIAPQLQSVEASLSKSDNTLPYQIVDSRPTPFPDAHPSGQLQVYQDCDVQVTAPRIDQTEVVLMPPACAVDHVVSNACADKVLLDSGDTRIGSGMSAGGIMTFHSRPSIPQPLSPPPALLDAERLLNAIKRYFEYSCQNMKFDDCGALITSSGAEWRNDPCQDFDSYCFTATMLGEKGLYVECRSALSKACGLVKQILQAEHPRALACFFEVFTHLIQSGLPEAALSLRSFVQQMSAAVVGKEHLWGQICWLLGELDPGSLGPAMAQLWECIADTFDNELGPSSRLAVSVRLDYSKRLFGMTDHLEEERRLRELLARFEDIVAHPTPRVMLNLAHNLNRQGRHNEAGNMASDVLCLLRNHDIYAGRAVENIESLKIIAHGQFHQGKPPEAEDSLRMAIGRVVEYWGDKHSWNLEFRTVLEGWLRTWGREDDARAVRMEIEELMENRDGE